MLSLLFKPRCSAVEGENEADTGPQGRTWGFGGPSGQQEQREVEFPQKTKAIIQQTQGKGESEEERKEDAWSHLVLKQGVLFMSVSPEGVTMLQKHTVITVHNGIHLESSVCPTIFV